MGQEDASDSSPSSAESSFRELDDVFLQTQTTIWLGEVLHTRLDEQLNISDLLADGELLFEVSKVIWKMLLTKCMELRHTKGYKYKPFASRKSSGRYLPYSNVDSFLKICKILGLTGIDLFSPSDVVEKRNTRKVCMCIRSLSKKARSKHLNVPDFDIVTYTVSMPTDMVGCIRRSLELSQCSFLSSANHSPHKDSKMKCRQKNSGAAGTRNYDLYSEESDDTESIYMVVGSHSPSATYSCDTASLMNSDFEISPGVPSDVESCTLSPSALQLDIQDHEKDECTPGENGSLCLTESVRTPCSGPVKDDNEPDSMSSSSCISSQIRLGGMVSCINYGVRHSHQNYAVDLIHSGHELGTGASIVGASVDGNSSLSSAVHHLAISDLIGHGADNSDSVLFGGENSIYNVYMGTDSHGSNSSQKTFVNGFGRILSDDIEDAEVSSMASMNYVSGRVLNLDFDDQLDVEYDFKTVKVQFPELQIGKVDFFETNYMQVYESHDRVKDKTMVHTSKPDTESPRLDMEVEDIGFSTKLFQPSLNWQSYATGCPDHVLSHNGICISQISSNVANDEDKLSSNLSSPLNNKGAFKNVDWDESQGFLSGQSHSTCDSHKWNERHNYAMALLSNGNDGHRASPKFVSSEGIHKEFLHQSPTKASGDALWIKDMKSIVADDDKEIFKFLKKSVTESHDGMVSLALICSFSRMRTYLGLGNSNARDVPENIVNAVAETLRKSDFLKVSEDGKKIGRVSELSKPEEIIEQVDIRTIAASPLEYDINIEDVESFFGQYGKVNSVRLPHHIADKRCFCGTALIEFSAEGDAEKVLKQNLVYSGTKLELKPKKVFDAKRTKSMEDLQKSHSSTGSNHKNNASTNTNYTKGLIVAFTLKRRSIGGPVGCNHKPDPTNNNGHVSMTEKELKSKENAIEESKHKVSEDVVGGYKNPLKNIEKGNGEKIEEKITKESEQKDSENAIHVTGKNSTEVVCQESMKKVAVDKKSTVTINKEKDIVVRHDLKDVFQRFGAVKYVDYTMGADSGYIRFEEPEAAQKARAAAAFVKEGGLIVKNFIASLEAVTGEAEREYWKLLHGNQERFREDGGGRGRGGKSNRRGRPPEAKRSRSKEDDSPVQRSSKAQKIEAV